MMSTRTMPEMDNSISIVQVDNELMLKQAFQIREEVYVVEQKVSYEEEFDEFDKVCRHFLATYNSIPVGVARWRKTQKGAKLERFAVLKEYRSKGIGGLLVKAVLDDVENQLGKAEGICYLHAQVDAVPLYTKYGFKPYGEQFTECDILHQAMHN